MYQRKPIAEPTWIRRRWSAPDWGLGVSDNRKRGMPLTWSNSQGRRDHRVTPDRRAVGQVHHVLGTITSLRRRERQVRSGHNSVCSMLPMAVGRCFKNGTIERGTGIALNTIKVRPIAGRRNWWGAGATVSPSCSDGYLQINRRNRWHRRPWSPPRSTKHCEVGPQ